MALRRAREIVRQLRHVTAPAATSHTLHIRGDEATEFVKYAFTQRRAGLERWRDAALQAWVFAQAIANIKRINASNYQVRFADAATALQAAEWLADLSDGYVDFGDLHAKLPGAVVVKAIEPETELPEPSKTDTAVSLTKPFFVGNDII